MLPHRTHYALKGLGNLVVWIHRQAYRKNCNFLGMLFMRILLFTLILEDKIQIFQNLTIRDQQKPRFKFLLTEDGTQPRSHRSACSVLLQHFISIVR